MLVVHITGFYQLCIDYVLDWLYIIVGLVDDIRNLHEANPSGLFYATGVFRDMGDKAGFHAMGVI